MGHYSRFWLSDMLVTPFVIVSAAALLFCLCEESSDFIHDPLAFFKQTPMAGPVKCNASSAWHLQRGDLRRKRVGDTVAFGAYRHRGDTCLCH
jgi:hypothetical protein